MPEPDTPSAADLFARHQELKTQFINTEIELALTLCELAGSSREAEKARVHAENARRAYQGARRMMDDRPTGLLPSDELDERVHRLEHMLEDLPK